MDNWTRQFYKNELKEIYKPKESKIPEKKLLEEIKETISLKKVKSGLLNTLKKIFILFAVFAIIGLLFFGGIYFVLRYFVIK